MTIFSGRLFGGVQPVFVRAAGLAGAQSRRVGRPYKEIKYRLVRIVEFGD
jgi:hypothetical protein